MIELYRLADACILPGFDGTTAPDWVRRRLAEGLAGVVLYHENIVDRAQLTDLTRVLRAENSDIVIGIDEEGGDVTRLDLGTGSPWPGNLALGVVDDPQLTHYVASHIGADLAGCQVNLNLAPVVDVNTDPYNPVIATRAFGANPELVARHAVAYVTGMQDSGVAACAKHFPGHGPTTVDSHHDLPVVGMSRTDYEAEAFPPFRAAIAAGVASVMTAHIALPAYDRLPATLSRVLLTEVLRGELGFSGAVITDSLEMQAVHDRFGIAGAGVRAIAAGADALCVGTRYGEARTRLLRDEIVAAVRHGELHVDRLAEAAGRMARLAADYQMEARLPGYVVPSDLMPGEVPLDGKGIGMEVARRAILAVGVSPLASAAYVIELDPVPTPAIGDATWGIGALLARELPGTRVLRVTEDRPAPADVWAAEPQRPLVVTVRDLHRHPWLARQLDRILQARPDAVVVEMGVPYVRPAATAYLATYGASHASAVAAVELLLGRR